MMRTAAFLALALLVGGTSAEARGFKLKSKGAGKVGRGVLRAVVAATASGADSAQAAGATETSPVVDAASAAPVAGTQHAAAAVAPPTVTSGSVTPVAPPAAGGVEDTAPETIFGDAEPALPQTLRENSYFYQSFGTADPFRSLLAGDFQPKEQELVDLHTVKMVGVIWEPDEIAAMLQDAQGFGYTLRPGDSVKNGSVVSITQESLVARLNIFGQTTQLTLRLQHEE